MDIKNTIKHKIEVPILKTILYSLVLILSLSFIIAVIADKDKTFLGYTARIVVTGSMEPVINVNSLNIIKVCDINSIKENDIICYNYSQDIVHRVVEKTVNDSGNTVVHTKGDANENVDSIQVNNDMLIGKVVLTLNNLSTIIEKYSIEPGQVDSMALIRNIVTLTIVLSIVVVIIHWIIYTTIILVKSFTTKSEFDKNIDKYLDDIDELILYRELLLDLKKNTEENKPETRFRFIFNRIAKAKAEMEIKNLHNAIKDFKKEVKRCAYINKFGTVLDRKDKIKIAEPSIKDIADYCKNLDE